MKIIDVQRLTKFYKKDKGIKDVTFSIDEGEIFGFIGPNGAGKSTTIRTLLNFIYPTSGRATIFGKDIVKDSKEIRKKVGYLPSEVHYYDDMRVIDLLTYSSKFFQVKNHDRMNDLASRLELDLHRKIEDLSFGNRKKVGIVQALLHEPELLILDEPTGGLDPLMQHTFFELLAEERKKGVTIFFSSHILSEIQKMCDRVAIIKNGSLLKVESVKTLTNNKIKNITLTMENREHLQFYMDGMIHSELQGDQLKLLYSGDVTVLLKKLDGLSVKDILIEEPSLEDVFMHYYEK